MAFKMKSGNKVSFKNMGSSSPAHQITISKPDENATVEGVTKKATEGPTKEEQATIDKAKGKRVTAEEKQGITVNPNINKENASKSKWDFDWMQLLDSFLTSGGGKGSLLKAAGGALTKKSPNELLAMQKAREVRKEKNKQTVQERASEKFIKED